MKKYFTLVYHPDLIRLFVSLSDKSTFASLISSIFVMTVFYGRIPTDILSFWFMLNIVYIFIKVTVVNRLQANIGNEIKSKYYVGVLVGATFFSGILWGASSWMAVLYADSNYDFLLLGLLFGLISGGISTLSALFVIYLAFSMPIIILLFGSFLYVSAEVHNYIAILLLLFSYIVMTASYRMHRSLGDAIHLKELVEESQLELEQINSSLESRVEHELKKRQEQELKLLQQSRLAQMGEMISMIAHQWRQPLSAISAASGSLQVKIELEKYDKEFFRDRVEKIAQLSQHLSSTIDDFRSFFKSNKNREIFYLRDVTEGALSIIGTSLENKSIEIIKDYESSRSVNAYFNELKQVSLNLLKNAEDILILNDVKEPKIWIRTFNNGTKVSLEVEDNAGGINENIINHVFDPYFTTKEQFDGTGLGLYMSKTIVEEHGGGILSVRNSKEGAVFTLTFDQHEIENLSADENVVD